MTATGAAPGYLGADVAALDRVAATAELGAQRTEAVAGRTAATVTTLRGAGWFRGPAGEAYASHLETVAVPWLRAAAEALRRVAAALRAQADQQRGASDTPVTGGYTCPALPAGDARVGAGAPGAAGGPDPAAPWWTWVTPDADTLADPTFWLGTGSGAAFATLGEVDRHLVREVGEVRLLNGRTATIASGPNWDPRVPAWWRDTVDAEGFRRVATDPGLQRVARYSPWVITAAGQAIGDLAEPELTAGHRIARVAGTVVIDGTFGAVGGLLGGLGGSAVAPGPGTIAGGVAGGIAGGEIGAQVRERWAGGAIRWTGDRIDGLLDTVGGWFADPATTPAPASREALAPWDDLAFPSGVGGLDPVGGGGGR